MKFKSRRFTLLDAGLLVLLAGAVVWTAYRVHTQLQYHWEWKVIFQYLVRFDQVSGSWRPNLLLEGLFTTIRLSVWATLLATCLGAVMGLCRVSQDLFLRLISRAYVESVRNLPPLVLIFIFYYFFGDQIMPWLQVEALLLARSEGVQNVAWFLLGPADGFSAFASAVITLAVYEGAYITEMFRSGIESIEKGQWEASYALGLGRWQQMRHVILPQVVQRIIPPLAGQFISTIKDSAIVSVISIQELTFQGLQLMATTYLRFEVWITVTVLYLVLTLGCSLAARRVELIMSRSRS
ncbi:MAG: amino acid ABC transporter permease [Thermodesulfobacteriota bacterium]